MSYMAIIVQICSIFKNCMFLKLVACLYVFQSSIKYSFSLECVHSPDVLAVFIYKHVIEAPVTANMGWLQEYTKC